MRVAFAGTPQFAVPTLKCLVAAGITVAAVYTQPDRPAGRGRQLRSSPIKNLAQLHKLTIVQPHSLKDEHAAGVLEKFAVDVLVVVAYGLILPAELLDIPRYGCVNIHASLLPRWRGAAPIARAIEAGDTVTGVSIMKMDSGLDTGPIIATQMIPIAAQDNAETLHDRLAEAGAQLLLEVLPGYVNGEIQCTEQDNAAATYAPKLSKAEARINWDRPAVEVLNQIRAFNPWPVAVTFHGDERIRVLDARISNATYELPAGYIYSANKDGVYVACGEGTLQLIRLQRDNGKPLPVGEFLNGYPLDKGDSLH